uniref:Putative sugar uptake ABC transporter permease protein n=1 Tax=uncultured bacterium Contig394 TaxID=1393566 RepID=W0FNW7_9BACT|nr:putative sugar uptake ABC transporter permease protein [uncultured bacterium Contig394]
MQLKREEERYGFALITPSMLVVFGVIIVPIITTLVYSFVNIDPLSSHNGEFAGLSFYIKALSSSAFWEDLGRTLYFTAASTAIETVFGLMIALLLNQKFPGVRFLRAIIIIPWAIPTVVNGSLWKLMLNGEYGVINALLVRMHLIDSYQSWLGNPQTAMLCIVIADAWKMTPLAVIFFLAALQGIDKTRYEAAMVDGAGAFRRFTAITLPALRPTIMVIIVMRTVEKFKAFDIFYLMTRGGPANSTKTLMYDTYLQAFTNLNYSEAATLAYLIVLVVVMMTVVYIRMMKRGDER